jgi:hypothetical protein
MHASRFVGKLIVEAQTAAETVSYVLCNPQCVKGGALLLARIGQIVTMTAGEYWAAGLVELCHAPPAVSAV